MAFDKVFSGPPSDVAAPGSHQSPSLGIDVSGNTLYVSSGNGWQSVIPGFITGFTMQDTANGHTYLIQMTNGELVQTQIS